MDQRSEYDRIFELYVSMLRIRMVEEAVAEVYPQGRMRCPVHLSIGQEGVAVGVCQALTAGDGVFSAHRSHAHYLAKGGALDRMLAEFYGKATGCCGGRGGSMHLVDVESGFLGSVPIVGSSIPIAAGRAFASKLDGDGAAYVVFIGEGATEEGVFYEAANFAALKELPLVFICENNLYSVYTPLSERQPASRSRVGIAREMGLAVEEGDGNEVWDVYRKASQAVSRARRGDGPQFLEFDTYRWREHCGPNYDNDIGYRSEEEFHDWKERCPLGRCETTLSSEPDFDSRRREASEAIAKEIEAAFEYAETSPFPDAAEVDEEGWE